MLRSMKFSAVAGAVALAALAALALVACDDDGGDGAKREPEVSSSTARTIEIEMRDIAFSPARVEVAAGESVRFTFHNTGEAVHEAFLGDAKAQDEHEMAMDGDGMDHNEGGEPVTVDPGETGELVHTFEAGDELLIGCHQPGHYKTGMKVVIAVI